MNTIYRIARLELATLFFSPVAWLVIIIFTFQTTFHFFNALQQVEIAQQMGAATKSLSELLFSSPMKGLFSALQDKLFLYIPLLTMGLLSREISSGSIKLLLSSPIKASGIVMGKFLAMMAYGLLLMVPILLVVLCAHFSIAHLDMGMIVSGMLGLYLLICAYAAIGLFMSSLTAYQVVAAISTLAILAALNYIGYVWQNIDLIRDLTYFLSLSGRTHELINGLIRSKDILYFLLVIFLFLGFSFLKLRQATNSKGWLQTLFSYLLLTGAVLLVGYLTSRQKIAIYADMTSNQLQTITPFSQGVLKQLKSPVTLTTYVNVLDQSANLGSPGQRNIDRDRFENYTRFLPCMKLKYVYYYDTPKNPILNNKYPGLTLRQAAEKASALLNINFDQVLSPEQIKSKVNLKGELNTLVRQLIMGPKTAFLRMFEDQTQFPMEMESTTAFKLLLQRSVQIAWTSGHLERSIDSPKDRDLMVTTIYPNWRYNLCNQGFNSRTIELRHKEIPDETSILVLADPRASFGSSELNKIKRFIASGGNLLICTEPGQENILNPILSLLGVSMNPGMLVQNGEQKKPEMIAAGIPKDLFAFSNAIGLLANGPQVVFESAASFNTIKQGDFGITPFLRTDSTFIWNKMAAINTRALNITYAPEEGDVKASFNAGLLLKRRLDNKEQRIALIGDADFMSNREEIERQGQMPLTRQIFKWLSMDEFPVDIVIPNSMDTQLALNSKSLLLLKTIFVWMLPGFLIVVGALLLVKRNRK
jgi:ABC-2 type transport system permease protein